jgi:hypothetical protein
LKRSITLFIAVLATVVAAVAATGVASGQTSGSLPTLHIAVTGKTGISVSENTVPAGAVNIETTFSGQGGGNFGIIRLNDGVTPQQAIEAVQSHQGDVNALTQYGALVVAAPAPGTVQTVLSASDNYFAVNTGGNGQPVFAPFKVHQDPSPAALPSAAATQRTVEFRFHGPKKLHRGTIVREQNDGYLAHMIVLIGVRNKATGKQLIAALRAGKDKKAGKLASHRFIDLMDPASPGALQQSALHGKRGFYVEACFMDTQDGREHTQLGMERLVRVVK